MSYGGHQCEVCSTTADHKDTDGQWLCSPCALNKHKREIIAHRQRRELSNAKSR